MSHDPAPNLFTRIADTGKRVAGRVALGRGQVRDEEQLLSLVDQAAERSVLEDDDRAYIHSLVEFGETLAREVMVPRVDMVTVSNDATVRGALEQLLASRHSRVPVIQGDIDDIAGVAYLRDAAGFVLRRPEESETALVERIMKPAMFVPELMQADALLRQMQAESNHLALVVDEYGGISGLVTLEDLIEELLGEISDEHDREVPEVERRADGSYLVGARLSVDDLGDLFGVDLEDDEVETVGGLIAKHLGRLPETGDTVVVEGIELRAASMLRRMQRLLTAEVRWAAQEEDEHE